MDFILLPETSLSTRFKDTYHSLEMLVRTRVQSVSTNWKEFKPKLTLGAILLTLFASLSTASVLALTVSLSSLLIDEAKWSPAAAWASVAAFLIALAVTTLLLFRRSFDPGVQATDITRTKLDVRRAEHDFKRHVEELEQHLTTAVSEAQDKALQTADEVRTVVHQFTPTRQVRQHPWGAMAAAALVGILAVRK